MPKLLIFFYIILYMSISAFSLPITTGLIGYWSGDNGAIDDSHHGNDGTLNTTGFTTGIEGNAFQFDGSSTSYIAVSDNDGLSPHTGPNGEMTVSAWVYLTSLPTQDVGYTNQSRRPIISKGNTSGWEYALYVYTTGAVGFSVWQPTGAGYGEPSGGNITMNEWHFLVGTMKKGEYVRIYMDGILVAENASPTGDTGNSNSPVYIGRRSDGQFFSGIVDEVALYNQSFSSSDISYMYSAIPELQNYFLFCIFIFFIKFFKKIRRDI